MKRLRHIHLGYIATFIMLIVGLFSPEVFIAYLTNFTASFHNHFDWFVMLSSSLFLIICVGLIFSPYGKIRLGNSDEIPQYSTFSWLAMLFAAGMGSGLVFWGVAEPLTHYYTPPPIATGADTAERAALVMTHLHWALHPWAIYAICALTVAFFAFRHGQGLLASGPIRTLLKGPSKYIVGEIIDVIAILAVVFGIVATLGMGTTQIFSGLRTVFSTELDRTEGYAAILAVLSMCYMLSASTSLSKGIKPLSNLNMLLALGLFIFIFFAGPTTEILQTVFASTFDYLKALPVLSFELHLEGEEKAWRSDWTISYFLWWIAWGPFVGVFIARISRGRTIREFLLGVVLAPSLFSMLWFSVMGGAGLELARTGAMDFSNILSREVSQTTYYLLSQYPLVKIMGFITLILMFVFLITSADSGTYVLAMFTSRGQQNPHRVHRLLWGITLGLVAAIAVLGSPEEGASNQKIEVMRVISAAGAIPFLGVMMVQCIALFIHLRKARSETIQNRI